MSEEIAQALADLAAAQQLWQELQSVTAENARLRAELEAARAQIQALIDDRPTADDMEQAARFHQEDAIAQRQQKRALRAELEAARAVVEAVRQWMAQDTSLLPIEKTDWITVGAIIDAVRAYDAATNASGA
jgi:predicted RNase H-like nuclease (RuvC/YqgF family)